MQEKSNLDKMEELDARVEKINYDLIGLENRKKIMEDEKLNKQKEIEKLEKEKSSILAKTDKMTKLQKFIYIVISLKNDLKRVDLINAKISELQKEKDSIQKKIDIQNNLYVETIKEKEKYIEQRKELYTSRTSEKESTKKNEKMSQIKALTQIHKITSQFKDSKIMSNLNHLVENGISQCINSNRERKVNKQSEEQDEME